MYRTITDSDIDYLLSFITPNPDIPKDSADSLVKSDKDRLSKQLIGKKIHEAEYENLRFELEEAYFNSKVQAGESVGIICAQSIGEKNTQSTLNSVVYNTEILYVDSNGQSHIEMIGSFIERLLENDRENVFVYTKNRTDYLDIAKLDIFIPASDCHGNVLLRRIEAVTQHLPVGNLISIKTKSGRSVIATRQKSFLVWSESQSKYLPVDGTSLKVGQYVPTTHFNQIHDEVYSYFHVNTEYMLTRGLGMIFGSFISDGYLHKDDVVIRCKNPIVVHLLKSTMIPMAVVQAINRVDEIEYYITIHDRFYVSLIRDTTNSFDISNKTIPSFVYSSNHNFIYGFLYTFTNGINTIKYQDNGDVLVYTVNKRITRGLSYILSLIGIRTSVSLDIYDCCVLIMGQYAKHFIEVYLPLGQIKTDIVNVFKDEIIEISEVSRCPNKQPVFVYDLTVEGPRTFQLFNGLNVNDTFHKAGLAEKTVTTGVPRLEEIISATKAPKIINHKIYFKSDPKSITDIRNLVGSKIVGLKLSDIVEAESTTLHTHKKSEAWYDVASIFQGVDFLEHRCCVSFKMKMDKLYMYKLSLKSIATRINEYYCDLFCVYSPDNMAKLDIFVDISKIKIDRKIMYANKKNMEEIYLDECVEKELMVMLICGIPGVLELFYVKDKNGIWYVETTSNIAKKVDTFVEILGLESVDATKTISNNIWDLYSTLGVEAAREYLTVEFAEIMEGVNPCHYTLLMDKMTYNGTIDSISRYTLRSQNIEPFSKASFEEPMQNFINTAFYAEEEQVKGVSASIMCGKRTEMGTGFVKTRIDIDQLPMFVEDTVENEVDHYSIDNIDLVDLQEEVLHEYEPDIDQEDEAENVESDGYC